MPENDLSVARPTPGVVLVTLDHPEQRNAMSGPMTEAWSGLMADLADDRDLRVLVVTGAGSAFCSGGDTSWIAGEPGATVADLRARMLPFYRAWLSVLDLDVPTIAAVNGPAIGAGLCLALACDLRYAASTARFAAPFVRLGMHPGMAATWLLPDVVGPAHAREGFVEAVLETAAGIAATAPVASRLTTRALRGGGHADLGSAMRWEALAQPVTLATEDLQEGVRAARERRIPRFTGR
jgi:enoyl-CoA hydratase